MDTQNLAPSTTPSILDWILEPSPNDKKANCGRLTQITVYTNGTVSVKAFYCHRYDCPRCSAERKKQVVGKILGHSTFWYVRVIGESELSAARKKVKRSGDVYCAVGAGNDVLLLTKKPTFPDSRLVAMDLLKELVEQHLECGYSYRHRRFRHSNGLFPSSKNHPLALTSSAGMPHLKRWMMSYFILARWGSITAGPWAGITCGRLMMALALKGCYAPLPVIWYGLNVRVSNLKLFNYYKH